LKEKAMRFLLAIPLAAALCGCASTDYGYSQLDGRRYHRASLDTYPVMVVEVDGRSEVSAPVRVLPGKRDVAVQPAPVAGFRQAPVRHIALDVAPCTRYYLVAVRPNSISQDYSVKVDQEEPVAGCTAPKG
jgi:hypothetical protein